MQRCVCFLIILNLLTDLSFGVNFRFASYYGDHMVLQRAPESSVIWGYGSDKAVVKVSLSGPQRIQAVAVSVINGIWKATLAPVQAGGPYNLTAVQKGGVNATLLLTDVLFGDVWLCGGQSNMAFTLGQVFNASEELATAIQFPEIRVFQAALEQSKVELTDLARVAVPWSRSTPEVLGGKDFTHFSSVCWLFGRYLYEKLKYPLGLVESCWGGTPIEAWSSPRVLHKCGLLQESFKSPDLGGLMSSTVLWNAMIHPLLNMTIKGVIWYQGEANTQYDQAKYACTFPALIDDWRIAFYMGSEKQTALDFPFGFVQLSTNSFSKHDGFAEVRWHQTADYGYVPNDLMKKTFMAVALDLPDKTSPWGRIHPRDKQDVAYRLVLGARAIAYGEQGVSFQGPFPSKVVINQTFVNISYDQKIQANLSPSIFEICCSKKQRCDADSVWITVPMKELGNLYVLVSIGSCPENSVAALRYAWTDWPCGFKACPIYSQDGVLPAPPFTRDLWRHKCSTPQDMLCIGKK